MTNENRPERSETHRLHWRAANTGAEWFSRPLTQQEAETAAAAIRNSREHRQAGITATVERAGPSQ